MNRRQGIDPAAAGLVAGLVVVTGLLFWGFVALQTFRSLYDHAAARRYVATQGVIEDVLIVNYPRGGPTYGFEYRYEVGGRVYRGRRVSVGPVDTQALARRWPEGTRVTVYYDPRDPRRAVLIRDLGLLRDWQWPAFVFLTLSPLLAYLLLRRHAPR
ncbi:hypothetical protein Mterra_03214 [Calidithermus terrae]|uniref:DUF3592 domain-containing protein n=1 Tax=Calidithermus terrae TaxID=1408545 RepID=A0A399EED9_9DEIN|nr:DUF3592 domain-containing protein [Calidithermus terrae]RIH81350.1 hypothetical protein Mterra_03214 [Calidithermus terrae]